MLNRRQLIEYACPECDAGYAGPETSAGSNTNCHHCKTDFMIPTGIQPKLLTVGTSEGRPLTLEETQAVYKTLALRSAGPPANTIIPEDIDYGRPLRRRVPAHRRDDDKQVELGFGEYAKLKVDVDGKTRNAMATTFLGGVLVALGVFIAAMFGIKKRS